MIKDPERCPHIIRKRAGDETYDICELTEGPSGRVKPCLLVSSDKCDTWNEIQEEWANERAD